MLNQVTGGILNSVYFTDANSGYAVGYGGTIITTNNGGGYPVEVTEIKPASGTLKLYPNPASDDLTIETAEKATLFVFDLNCVLLLHRELTEHTSKIDVSTLRSGVYLVKLIDAKRVQVGKFIKQ